MVGLKFGRLTVLGYVDMKANNARVRSQCDCGNEKVTTACQIKSGHTVSCGCARLDAHSREPLSPLILRMKKATRRKAKSASDTQGSHTLDELDALYLRQKGKCAEPSCRKVFGLKFEIDHIIPLAKGGTSDIRNLQLLCRPCNGTKGSKHPTTFAMEKGRLL